ncbi:MAG: DUF4861 family protein [Bacteroidales bacterium]|nr:DUF4861 family protein [Bacteroidales bacterium]
MKKYLILLALPLLFACKSAPEVKVMARAVPERADDFVFENNLVAGRFYGKALEGNPTSPGIDIWVKLPGALVADSWYAEAQKSPDYYHHDHGGKDCYKVAVSLGGGASAPFIDGRICYPATNYRSSEILVQEPGKVSFALEYPEWEAAEGIKVCLRKEVTLSEDSYFADVADYYSFTGTDSLSIAAGIKLHSAQNTIEAASETPSSYAIWEKASDQSIEPEDGMLGVAVILPGAEELIVSEELDHALLIKTIAPGEALRYRFGSCWSKGNIKTSGDWFALAK